MTKLTSPTDIDFVAVAQLVLALPLAESSQQMRAMTDALVAMQAMQDMRENADLVRNIYKEFPDLQGASISFYFSGQREMDFYFTDISTIESDENEMEHQLHDALSDFFDDSLIAGALNSDDDILKFHKVLPLTADENDTRTMKTTREQVEATAANDDHYPNELAAVLFPASWQDCLAKLGLDQMDDKSPLSRPRG